VLTAVRTSNHTWFTAVTTVRSEFCPRRNFTLLKHVIHILLVLHRTQCVVLACSGHAHCSPHSAPATCSPLCDFTSAQTPSKISFSCMLQSPSSPGGWGGGWGESVRGVPTTRSIVCYVSGPLLFAWPSCCNTEVKVQIMTLFMSSSAVTLDGSDGFRMLSARRFQNTFQLYIFIKIKG
jgi:hypothetical protein